MAARSYSNLTFNGWTLVNWSSCGAPLNYIEDFEAPRSSGASSSCLSHLMSCLSARVLKTYDVGGECHPELQRLDNTVGGRCQFLRRRIGIGWFSFLMASHEYVVWPHSRCPQTKNSTPVFLTRKLCWTMVVALRKENGDTVRPAPSSSSHVNGLRKHWQNAVEAHRRAMTFEGAGSICKSSHPESTAMQIQHLLLACANRNYQPCVCFTPRTLNTMKNVPINNTLLLTTFVHDFIRQFWKNILIMDCSLTLYIWGGMTLSDTFFN